MIKTKMQELAKLRGCKIGKIELEACHDLRCSVAAILFSKAKRRGKYQERTMVFHANIINWLDKEIEKYRNIYAKRG